MSQNLPLDAENLSQHVSETGRPEQVTAALSGSRGQSMTPLARQRQS